MAVIVKLESSWFICDSAWAGLCFEGAIELSTNPTSDPRMIARCVPSSSMTNLIKSELDPDMALHWDLEFLEPDILYPTFKTLTKGRPETWKKLFRFTLHSADLLDFNGQVRDP